MFVTCIQLAEVDSRHGQPESYQTQRTSKQKNLSKTRPGIRNLQIRKPKTRKYSRASGKSEVLRGSRDAAITHFSPSFRKLPVSEIPAVFRSFICHNTNDNDGDHRDTTKHAKPYWEHLKTLPGRIKRSLGGRFRCSCSWSTT